MSGKCCVCYVNMKDNVPIDIEDMTTEERLIEKFHLENCDITQLSPDFDGHEVYMAVPEGGTEEQPLYVGIPMVFLVKGEEIEKVDSDMALILMEMFTPQEKIERSFGNFTPYESDKEFKRMYQSASPEKQKEMGFDFTKDADWDEIEYVRQANEWLRDGQPVD